MQGQEHVLHEIVAIGGLEEPMPFRSTRFSRGMILRPSCA
jgi:hypothetical protein